MLLLAAGLVAGSVIGQGAAGEPAREAAAPAAPPAQLEVLGSVSAPAATALVPVRLTAEVAITALQFDLLFAAAGLTPRDVLAGSALQGHLVESHQPSPGVWRVLIYSAQSASVLNGPVAFLRLAVNPDLAAGAQSLRLANVVLATPQGNRLREVGTVNGTLVIRAGQLYHGQEDLAWLLGAAEARAAEAEIVARHNGLNRTLYQGPVRVGSVPWNTLETSDGRYTLVVTYKDATGAVLKRIEQPAAVNNAPRWHSGQVSANEVWAADRVHVIEGVLTLAAGVTVQVAPGAVVKFVRGARIEILNEATLSALGQSAQRIVFTSLADDTVGGDTNLDGNESGPLPGDWGGFVTSPQGVVNLNEHAELRFTLIRHQGTLAASETWSARFLHWITGDLVVPAGITLTLEPGAIVKLDAARRITVLDGGRLKALGTVPQPIHITSVRDDRVGGDTNRDGDQTQPAAGDWGWLFFNGGSGQFDHCVVRYGAGPAAGGWGPAADPLNTKGMFKTHGAASLSISNSVLTQAFYDGLLAWGGEASLVNCVLSGIDRAVTAHPGSPVRVVNCTLYDNRLGLVVHGGRLDVFNTIVANSFESGVQMDFGTMGQILNCNVWSPPSSSGRNYRNLQDQTGQNGNLSANPRFNDPANLDFRLTLGSPCLDAAEGTLAPPTDALGIARVDDPRVANTGVATPSGAFADLGAYEFAEAANVSIDLVAEGCRGPANVVGGDDVEVSWTVHNAGQDPVAGPWHDAVYLRNSVTGERLLVGEVLTGPGLLLLPGERHFTTATLRVPGSAVGTYQWEIVANNRHDIFEGANQANNDTIATGDVEFDLPELILGGHPQTGFLTSDEPEQWFKFTSPAGLDILLALTLDDPEAVAELYVSHTTMPTSQTHLFKHREWGSASVTTLVSEGVEQVYYILARARSLPKGRAGFNLAGEAVGFQLDRVIPGRVGNLGEVTLELLGARLGPEVTYRLKAADGTTRPAERVRLVNSGQAYVTFNLKDFPPGLAQAVADWNGTLANLPEAVEIVDGAKPDFYAYLTGPDTIRAGRVATWYIVYGNRGFVDVPLPLLTFTIAGAQEMWLLDSTLNWTDTIVLLGMNDKVLLPTLGPGQEVKVPVRVKPGPNPSVEAVLRVLTAEDLLAGADPIGWERLVPPQGADTAAWNQLIAQMRDWLGTTLQDYYRQLLRDLAGYAAGELAYEYLLNANGQWLAGPEIGAPALAREVRNIQYKIDREPALAAQAPGLLSLPALAAPKKKDGIRKTYWVVIGDEDYRLDTPDGKSDLPGVRQDLYDLVDFLHKDTRTPTNQIKWLYDFNNSTNDTLTRADILATIRSLKDVADGDDNVVIYYSGHGGVDNAGKGYMDINGSFVTPGQLRGAIDDVGAGTTYFLNDSCHSEAFNSNVGATNTSFVGMAATSSNTVSWCNRRSGSDFTREMKKNLRECHGLDESFKNTHNTITNTYSSRTNATDRQNPKLTNDKGVDLSGKNWKDPSGSIQEFARKLRERGEYTPAWHRIISRLVGSFDPNDKTAPLGYGPARYVSANQLLPYTVFFENKGTAEAPAQEVLVLDRLDADLDWSTLELQNVGFNGVTLTLPPGLQHYSGVTNVASDPYPVHIQASFDPASGELAWRLESRDPATGQLPEDPFAGFLPPNDATRRGEGFVSYTVKPRASLSAGTVVTNAATIIFDPTYGANAPIETPTVLNTLDFVPPESAVKPLPARSAVPFLVEWSGTDEPNGAGVVAYDILVSAAGAAYEPWLVATTDTQAYFTGLPEVAYRFYSVAIDGVGHREAAPTQPDAFTVAFGGAIRITRAEFSAGNLALDLENLAPGADYVIESSATLTAGSWQTHRTFRADAATTRQVLSVGAADKLFFRIRSQ